MCPCVCVWERESSYVYDTSSLCNQTDRNSDWAIHTSLRWNSPVDTPLFKIATVRKQSYIYRHNNVHNWPNQAVSLPKYYEAFRTSLQNRTVNNKRLTKLFSLNRGRGEVWLQKRTKADVANWEECGQQDEAGSRSKQRSQKTAVKHYTIRLGDLSSSCVHQRVLFPFLSFFLSFLVFLFVCFALCCFSPFFLFFFLSLFLSSSSF